MVSGGGSSNGNEWTSGSHITFLLPESALRGAQLMLDSVFISLYVVLTDQILLHLPPPTSSITISLSHTMIMAKTLFHDPFRIFHFETQESIREIGKNGTITLNSLLHSSFNNDGSSQGYVSSPTF